MDPAERRRLLGDVVEQIEELTLLMNDLIELARGEEPRAETEDVRLDLLVGEAIDRARRHAPADAVRDSSSRRRCIARRAGTPRARRQQPDRQRRQVQPAGRAGRGRRCTAAS